MSPAISLPHVESHLGRGTTIMIHDRGMGDFFFFVFYIGILAGRRQIADFAAAHIFRTPGGERVALLGPRERRTVLFHGFVTGVASLLLNSFLLWEGILFEHWISRMPTWWFDIGTLFLASALLVARVTSYPKPSEAGVDEHADGLGATAQEIGVVLVLLPLAQWLTRTSYYNRVYIYPVVDTQFLSYVVQPVLGAWCFYWATGLRGPVQEVTAPEALSA